MADMECDTPPPQQREEPLTFFTLPRELRDKIYEYHFEDRFVDCGIDLYKAYHTPERFPSSSAGITLASKQLRHETFGRYRYLQTEFWKHHYYFIELDCGRMSNREIRRHLEFCSLVLRKRSWLSVAFRTKFAVNEPLEAIEAVACHDVIITWSGGRWDKDIYTGRDALWDYLVNVKYPDVEAPQVRGGTVLHIDLCMSLVCDGVKHVKRSFGIADDEDHDDGGRLKCAYRRQGEPHLLGDECYM